MHRRTVDFILCATFIVYTVVAYGNPPQAIANLLASPAGKLLVLSLLALISMFTSPLVGLFGVLAVVISLPHLEYFSDKTKDGAADKHLKPSVGKNVQERRVEHTDTESQLRKPKVTAGQDFRSVLQQAKKAIGKPPQPMAPTKKVEKFQSLTPFESE